MNDNPDKHLILNHDADGIKELDNNLPRWWLWLLNISIIYGLAYMAYFHVFDIGHSAKVTFQRKAYQALLDQRERDATTSGEAELNLQPLSEVEALAAGETIFVANCLVCHTATGGGSLGPNLCDEYFLHGPTFSDSYQTIKNGVVAKGMIAWKKQLKPDQIHSVASYIWTFRGSNPDNPKAPEGDHHSFDSIEQPTPDEPATTADSGA